MTISELAKQCGVKVETIRYYERRGLVPDPRPGGTGYRDYSVQDVRRVQFIRHAQELGFTLNEIGQLLELRVETTSCCARTRELAESKIEQIDEKVRRLRTFKKALSILVARCGDSDPDAECPILDAIDKAKVPGSGRRQGKSKSPRKR